ncbi:retron system putative HNH endonuclease [Brucella gallinifaecis]|uniref:TIGR02646 family protein n=1 Tax=Brucella gallinifaecis TaxID=215590 RepID=A0A502BP17_9HYPH|nr:retron system putative HNH endonuclease [Brucella gallinifaecis]TPF75935.1 TIGR02646 family protein [Brucella gallinifaecis]
MKGARKGSPPEIYLEWVAKENEEWKPSYPFNENDVRKEVVNALHRAQRGLCVYCGQRLDMSRPGKTYHIEHFRPQGAYPHLSVDYGNLYLSCGQEGPTGGVSQTCGTQKGDWFDEATHIEPIYENCTQAFIFHLNGNLSGKCAGSTAIIEILNLNHPELNKDREQLIKLIDLGSLDASDFWDSSTGLCEGYAHVAFNRLGKIIP